MGKYNNGLRRAIKAIKRELIAEAYRHNADEVGAAYKNGYHAGLAAARSILDDFAKRAGRFDRLFEREALQRYFYGE